MQYKYTTEVEKDTDVESKSCYYQRKNRNRTAVAKGLTVITRQIIIFAAIMPIQYVKNAKSAKQKSALEKLFIHQPELNLRGEDAFRTHNSHEMSHETTSL